MKKQQILIVSDTAGENSGMENSFRREPDWEISLASSAEEAITLFYSRPFDIVILSKELSLADEQKLRAVLNHCSFDSILLRNENDNAEEFKKTMRSLMNSKKAEALKHIQVNDTLNVNNLADDIRIVSV